MIAILFCILLRRNVPIRRRGTPPRAFTVDGYFIIGERALRRGRHRLFSLKRSGAFGRRS